jgi:hypothetical protein
LWIRRLTFRDYAGMSILSSSCCSPSLSLFLSLFSVRCGGPRMVFDAG